MASEIVKDTVGTGKFKVLLNGGEDLRKCLETMKKECEDYEMHYRKRCKRRYYQLGLMAKVVPTTTDYELHGLLRHDTRTFAIDSISNSDGMVELLAKRITRAVELYQQEDKYSQIVTSLALEIQTDNCRIGRMRNDCAALIVRGEVMTLTTNSSYRNCCFKEITYVTNLKYYLKALNINDEIAIGKDVRGHVAKILKDCVSLVIDCPGLITSFDFLELPNQCYSLQPNDYPELFAANLELAAHIGANFIIVSNLRCKSFLESIRKSLANNHPQIRVIGDIDFEFVSSKMLDIMGIIRLLDFLWISDMFNLPKNVQTYIYEDVVPIARTCKKGIIGTVPLQRCSDFKLFENDNFLWNIDAILIEKSPWCNKYPLIVKKLLPVQDYRMATIKTDLDLKKIVKSFTAIANFIIRTISSIETQALFLYSRCENAAFAFSGMEIYCPVFVILPLVDEELEQEAERNKKLNRAKIEATRMFNLHRNIRPIIYSVHNNESDYTPLEYGMNYARIAGIIRTGDFIITVQVGNEDGSDIEFGVGEDVVMVRSFYLPPEKIAEKFKYA